MAPVRHLVIVTAILACAGSSALHADELAAPVALPDSEAYLLAIIPDLQATLGRAEQIGGLFSSAAVPAGTLSTVIGGALGDPGLANLAKGPVMVVLGPGTPTPSVALLLPATNVQSYIDLAAQKGFLMGKAVGNLAVVAQTPDGQAMGERIAAAVPALPAVPPGTDIRVLTATSRLVKAYAPFLTGLVQMGTMNMPQQPGQPPLGKIALLEVVGLFEVLGAVESSQVDISLAERTVAVDQRIAAVPGSALAKALVAPPAGPNRAQQRLGGAPGAAVVLAQLSQRVDQAAMIDYALSVANVLLARPEAKDVFPGDAAAALATFKELAQALTGELAMRMLSSATAPWQLEMVMGIADRAKAGRFYDAMFGLFTGDGALAKFYQGMGMTMTVKKDARTIGGLPVMIQGWTIDEAKLPPQSAAMTKAMARETEVALGPDFIFSAQDPQVLDALVTGPANGGPTMAEAVFGGGRQIYAGADVPGMVRALVAALKPPAAAAGAPAAAPPPSDPLLVAVTLGGGRQRIELRIPLAPFVGLGATLQALQPPHPGRGPRPPAAQPPPSGGNAF